MKPRVEVEIRFINTPESEKEVPRVVTAYFSSADGCLTSLEDSSGKTSASLYPKELDLVLEMVKLVRARKDSYRPFGSEK